MTVYYAILKERQGAANELSFDSILNVVEHNAAQGYERIAVPYMAPAHARNAICQAFLARSNDHEDQRSSSEDVLVMMDADHLYPRNVVERLASHRVGVVGALATAKGDVPFTCFFKRDAHGDLCNLTEWEDGELVQGTVVGTGCIAIKRWVLAKALKHCAPSWFRYLYGGFNYEPSEDMYFGYECEKAGIPHYCDTSLWIPHLTFVFTDASSWKEYLADHPEARAGNGLRARNG